MVIVKKPSLWNPLLANRQKRAEFFKTCTILGLHQVGKMGYNYLKNLNNLIIQLATTKITNKDLARSLNLFDACPKFMHNISQCYKKCSLFILNIFSIALSIDGIHLAVGLENGTIEIWNINNESREKILLADSKPIKAIAYSADGQKLAIRTDKNIQIWDTRNNTCLLKIDSPNMREKHAIAFSPDGNQVACTDLSDTKEVIKIYNVSTSLSAHMTVCYTRCENLVCSLRYENENMLKIAFASKTINWNIKTDKKREYVNNVASNYVITSNPNDTFIALSKKIFSRYGDVNFELKILDKKNTCIQTLEIFEVPLSDNVKGQFLAPVHLDQKLIQLITFSSDYKKLAAATKFIVYIFDTHPLTELEKRLNKLTFEQQLLILVFEKNNENIRFNPLMLYEYEKQLFHTADQDVQLALISMSS